MPKQFKGKIKLDVRDSTADWDAFLADKAPEGAPNVLVVLYDDTGQAAWSPYGGRIDMPTMDRLAANGLTYSQWHTTALCSPTRSTFLTGRNHHLERLRHRSRSRRPASPATTRTSRPRTPRWRTSCATPAGARSGSARTTTSRSTSGRWARRRRTGRSARATTASTASSAARPTTGIPTWPRTTTTSTSPTLPEDGYHLSKDLADQALRIIRDSKQTEPDKPWYLWFCPGANHAPHHAPQEYIDKYKGKFDDGYEAYREWVLPRMIERGILPGGHRADADQPDGRGHRSRPATRCGRGTSSYDAEKALFCRMAEVYAGFSRVHRRPGRPDRRLPRGVRAARQHDHLLLRRQRRLGRGQPERLGQRGQDLRRLPRRPRAEPDDGRPARRPGHLQPLPDRLGDRRSRRRTGCSSATSYQGGVCDPLVIHWPKGIKARGRGAPPVPPLDRHRARRSSTPAASRCPTSSTAYEQTPLPGVSMRYSFDARRRADAEADAVLRDARQPRHLARRAGRRSPSTARSAGIGNFDDDRWQLFHTDEDRSEAHDLADAAPREARRSSTALWFAGGRGQQRAAAQRPADHRHPRTSRPSSRWSSTSRCRRAGSTPTTRARARSPSARRPTCTACRTRCSPRSSSTPDTEGVIFAHGSRFGGHALFVKDGEVTYAYNFLGIPPEKPHLGAGARRPGTHIVGVEFTKERMGEHREGIGPLKLYIDDQVVGRGTRSAP